MTTIFRLTAALLLSLGADSVYAYGSSQSSSHCDKPAFSEFQPAANKYLQTFQEFSLSASANTTPTSIVVHVSAGDIKYEYTAKELYISQHKSGRYEVRGKIDRPIEHGFVRISVTAHSKPSCEKTDGYLVRIQ
ncbi:hypothetical protein ACH518_18690 [Methylomonas sp. HW2-6]|uniref:hypothetical protein n=1 Tax=Methylomonas TaxID=416 RepID=UPI0011269178|nr:hypothetical protein [Methylomonas koyamae]TPQ29067.1 hypothetical protein C2U68_03700 [Methylomonas koyamae]